MYRSEWNRNRLLVATIATLISVNAFLYFLSRGQTYVHIDAIAHVNKARGLFDNFEPGLRNLGSIWLPLPHLLAAPLTAIDSLWKSGAAGSLVSVASFVGTSLFLFSIGVLWTGRPIAGWLAFLLFALNPRLIYLFTTPENEPLMIFCATGLLYYLVRWTQHENWGDFALAALFAFAGTWTRYEGWALAAAACIVVSIVAKERRIAKTILFMGASVLGPMLWMLFNMFYFDDPLMFTYGIGSALANETGKRFGTSGDWAASFLRYVIDVTYCLNSGVVWLAVGGLALAVYSLRYRTWRPTFVVLAGCFVLFAFYVANLHEGNISILLPGVVADDPQSTYNVRYGAVMAATLPLFAGAFAAFVINQVERRRVFAILMLAPLALPDLTPMAAHESLDRQFTGNLFYTEATHNQSFWMPPFVEVSQQLGETGLVMANTRIVHVVVWARGFPMRRFVTEMNEKVWGPSLNWIDPSIRWAITEEGDQLWHAQGKWLEKNWIEVASAKGNVTGRVHLYRRPE